MRQSINRPHTPQSPRAMSSETPTPRDRRPRDRAFWVLVLLVALHFLWFAPRLRYPDLVYNYPFLNAEGHDWIANGFYLAGDDVRYSARPPLLPLAIAGLAELDLLDGLPVLIQILVHASALALYRLLRRDHLSRIAFPIALAWSFNFTWLSFSIEIASDVVAACLLGWSLLYFRKGADDRRHELTAGALAGLAALAQPAALLLLPALALAFARHRPKDLRSPSPGIVAGLLVFPSLLWWGVRAWLVAGAGEVFSRREALLGFDPVGFLYDLWAFPSYTGLGAALLIAFGLWHLARQAREGFQESLVLAFLVLLFVFSAFFYQGEAKRFSSPLFWLSAVPAAAALARVPRRLAPVVAIAAIAGSLTPLPGGAQHPNHVALWPLPPSYLHAATPGVLGLGFNPWAPRLAANPPRTLAERGLHRRVAEARERPRAEPTLDPREIAQDRGVLYFYDRPEESGRRYEVMTRLGNLLRHRVHFLPFSEFRGLLDSLEFKRAEPLAGHRLHRVELRGLEGTWLLAVPNPSEAAAAIRELRRASRRGEHTPRPAYGLAETRRIAERVAGDFPIVFSTPELEGSWMLYLPFLVEEQELWIIEPAREAGSRQLLDQEGERLGREVEDGIAITRWRLFGHTWAVIEESQEP